MKTVKLQNIVLQMNQDANFLPYSELIAKSNDWHTPFIYDPQKKCHILNIGSVKAFHRERA